MEVSSPGKFYRDTIEYIEWFNLLAGFNFFEKTVNLINARFLFAFSMLVTNIYFLPETALFYRDDIDQVLMCAVTLGFLFQVSLRAELLTFLELRWCYYISDDLQTLHIHIVSECVCNSRDELGIL